MFFGTCLPEKLKIFSDKFKDRKRLKV